MKKRLKRRVFISRITAATFTGAMLGGCINREKDVSKKLVGDPDESTFEDEISRNRKMPRDLVMKLLDQKVNQYMQISYHCAQSSFLALKEQFGLDGDEVLKALTPMAGIAERGETCGAVSGPLMIFGLIYGRGKNSLDNWEIYRDSLIPSGKFCTLFEQEYGSTMCHDIQKVIFGRCFHLTNPEDLKEFREAGATEQCSSVVRKAVRIAAEIILNDTK
ncbi:MAG: C_GCAxxG_C_C family protein [Bacteroidales bacterium]|nr:C_GCAxxG_C_C family protein [Bacteroidales bacterium]